MGPGRRLAAWLSATGLGAALLVAPQAGAQAAPAPAGGAVAPASRTVTLISGDRVLLTDDGRTSVERQPGREHVRFVSYRDDARHLHVIPSDALPLLRAGLLDARLFDVTALRDFGYHDGRADLPLIVTYRGEAARVSARSAVAGATVSRDLPAMDALAVRAPKSNTGLLWRSLTADGTATRSLSGGIGKVWLDGLRRPTLEVSVPQIGAPAAWQAGYDGTGVRVAVLDTGIDATHPDLAGKVIATRNFTEGEEDDRDLVGHGTHVASTIVGSGAASQGRYRGVAPGARVLDGKVCVDGGCADSWILAGMEWAAAEQHASIVNMSLGGPDTPGTDPVEEAVQRLSDQYGTLFVVASGNDGGEAAVGSPASADAALAVAAVDADDRLADFSNRGPRGDDGALKPDISAPGVDITAANSKDGRLGEPGEAYTTVSGTSMATPHVAGAAALLAQRHPDWSGASLKSTLMGSTKPTSPIDLLGQGAGRVDVAAAIGRSVTTAPASVSLPLQEWPHGDDPLLTRTVTYHNHGDADVTLALAWQAIGPDGSPAPAGMFSLDRQTVTVPAGGDATVRLNADTRISSPVGRFGGYLTASGGGLVVRTPFGVEKESERYPLTLVLTTRSGAPATDYSAIAFRLDTFDSFPANDTGGTDGTLEFRLPRGRYAIFSAIFEGQDEQLTSTLLAQPQLDLTGAQTVALDARLAKPVNVTVTNPAARGVWGEFSARTRAADLPGISLEMNMGSLDGFDRAYTGQIGPDQAVDGFSTKINGVLALPGPDGSLDGSPFAYHLAWFREGRMFNGLDRRLSPSSLATVRENYAAQGTGTTGATTAYARARGLSGNFTTTVLPFTLPFTRTEYFNTDGEVQWTKLFQERVPRPGQPANIQTTAEQPDVAYRAGQSYDERWNRGVFGPSLAGPGSSPEWVSRQGDTILAAPPIFTEGSGRRVSGRVSNPHIALYRDGKLLAEAAALRGEFTVPAGDAGYRLQIDAQRAAPLTLTTRASVAWTFRSAHVDSDQPLRLPLSVVRFTPALDERNSAPAGLTYRVPVTVETQPGSAAGTLLRPTVEASFDDGQTWRPVPVLGEQGGWYVRVPHPAADGYVSLRARATDTAGNTVDQTIIRAYRIGG
ncbi:S8 family serine peptidase [Plantactinospora soyae]|uniref:Subtilisin family serine protease n=1 Tax=Plantactinospora soyae TaxID=1544732 RepID=A0A927M5V2_9ACTN|nr:S8 family serine peptidase [Plantactinospora soyae]MBE1488284.1 subtilisin family serine protease [Plantactinospora soyae]